ncbi:MAG: magnesium transporter CorA family protein [Alphaproteobacteria bacterium]|nr:magnesium transporter CorA family protein [Alphaproteobacteria bacterium]
MIRVFVTKDGCLRQTEAQPQAVPQDALWVDLLNPTSDELRPVEQQFSIQFPTREEMQEIEASSRLYYEDGASFMTATVVSRAETDSPESTAITFILAGARLITLRFAEPLPFTTFPQRAERQMGLWPTSDMVLVGLLEAVIDRTADILERVSYEVESVSRDVFGTRQANRSLDAGGFQDVLVRLGRKNDLTSKVRESLISINRLLTFLANSWETKPSKDLRAHIKTMTRDVSSLSDHTAYLSNKITFLLDATLGMVSIEQNRVIRILAVASTVFLPPTVLASIWGMNFNIMPETEWSFGYPFALLAILVSGVLPVIYFKWRGWF